MYLNELITIDEFRADQKKMAERLEYLTELEQPLEEPDFEKIESSLKAGWKDAYKELDKTSKREFWRIIVKEIRIFPDRSIDYDLAL